MISNVPSKAMKFRSKIIMTGVFSLLFAAVAVNFFKLSVIDNEKYQAMANEMHFGSIKISAHRGSIYDAEGTPLAKSASVYKIYLDPKRFKEEMLSLQSRIDRQTEQKKNGTYSPVFDDDGNIQIGEKNNRRIIKTVRILDDGIHIENALNTKTLRIKWNTIASITKSKEVRDGLEIRMKDGKYIAFGIYNSYKLQQITQFIANYIAEKANGN